ncbi:MAG: SDR family oxidoreductase [Pseudomonadota bacterium]
MRVLVLGGYGLIGLAVSKRLIADGHKVIGLARSGARGRALLPEAEWREADISKLQSSADWQPFLENVDVVVNAAGALQDGLKDNVTAVQYLAITALIDACQNQGIQRIIQISAPGVSEDSQTRFYRTKAKADQALMQSALSWTILRPGLVIAPQAYGGTSLIRTLAAVPWVQPIVLANTPVQTISVDDVAEAVSIAVSGKMDGMDVDLVEAKPQTLADLVLAVRSWLGFAPPRAVIPLPSSVGIMMAKGADLAGWLGWRSALRSTSLSVLKHGVTGDASAWQTIAGRPASALSETLHKLPSTVQERVYARMMLAYPILLIVLSVFWIASGMIGLFQHDRAVAVIQDALPDGLSHLFVRGGSLVDIVIGAGMLFRPSTRWACFASILVSVGYMVGAALFTPELWSDPLGPMVKVFPGIGLAIIVATLTQER